jgi:hypothetical protein
MVDTTYDMDDDSTVKMDNISASVIQDEISAIHEEISAIQDEIPAERKKKIKSRRWISTKHTIIWVTWAR